ncbi:YncE family protein [Kurthia sibirica]|uniref:YncE family protein n=1 Tax=Kurthia sibirica TaxID=202750 RepID=A0A2U3AJI7_9BACL|nr:hypothetical protein [Kurthia sibirica]PWI24644.1 hypothetical protein DEX24_12515 [Kurthia sibirica]GEK33475.1 hypothetical protein KSI01_10080 [Kurthia sibirica]
MKKITLVGLLCCVCILAACDHTSYEKITKNEDFIASVNILQPSIDFINTAGNVLASWSLEEPYTGATLIGDDAILLYGNQMEHADLVRLSSGKQLMKIDVKRGATNAYYNKETTDFYITNGDNNTVTSYQIDGQEKQQVVLGNYPMAMYVKDTHLFVINFKDNYMSVLNSASLKEEKTYAIPKSSHGIDFVDGELWIGGHGAGEKPNSQVRRMNSKTGKIEGMLDLPMMPIAFASTNGSEFVLSHGENMLYELNDAHEIIWQKEIGSNPFTIAAFQQHIVLAGYDDRTLYWIKNHKIIRKTKVGKGPFNLLVREGEQ